jgi:hypothetical protein
MRVTAFFFGAPGPFEILILAFILCVLAAPVVIVLYLVRRGSRGGAEPSTAGRIRCPQCAEWIMPEAVKCRYCGARFDRPQA